MKRKYILPGIISAVTFFTAFFLYCYTDLTSLTVWTLNIWDTLVHTGNIRAFYEYSAMNLYGLDHAMVGSDILIYIPWAIWNLPIWAIQHFAGIDAAYHALPQLWSKLFLLVIFFLCYIPVKKISFKITANKDEIHRMLFLSASSLFTITSLAYIGQNDVLVIFPFLMGLSCLMDDNNWGFYLWSALSIAFKPFFIFSYIGLILIKEKNLIKIVGNIAIGFSIYVLQKIPFIGAYLYKESLSYGPTGGAMKALFSSVLDIPPAGASLFILGLGVLYIAAYFSDKEKQLTDYIYMSVAPMIVFFIFTRYEAYRPFYLVPLMFILMMTKPDFNRINILLETAATGSLMAFYLLDDFLFYNPNYIWSKSGWENHPSISQFLGSKLPGFGYSVFTAVFVLCMVMILVINHPKFEYKNRILTMKEESWIIVLRSFIYCMPSVLSIFLKLTF